MSDELEEVSPLVNPATRYKKRERDVCPICGGFTGKHTLVRRLPAMDSEGVPYPLAPVPPVKLCPGHPEQTKGASVNASVDFQLTEYGKQLLEKYAHSGPPDAIDVKYVDGDGTVYTGTLYREQTAKEQQAFRDGNTKAGE